MLLLLISISGAFVALLGGVWSFFSKVPAWQKCAGELEIMSIAQLQLIPDLEGHVVWVSAWSTSKPVCALLHGKVAYWSTKVWGMTATRPLLGEYGEPDLLQLTDQGESVCVRVGTMLRCSEKVEARRENPFGHGGVPGQLNSKVEVQETAIHLAQPVSVIGKASREHGTILIRAHDDASIVWNGSASSLKTMLQAKTRLSQHLAPRLLAYGAFTCVISLLLWSFTL